MTQLPAVARNVHMMCKKCGVERFHVVVAHTSTTSAKVKCEVCGASGTFKLGKPEKAAKPSKSPSQRKSSSSLSAGKKSDSGAAVVWMDLKTQIGTDRVVPYSMKSKFALANAIEHPKFGIGFVTAATNDKIEVMFQEGGRALVHNRQ